MPSSRRPSLTSSTSEGKYPNHHDHLFYYSQLPTAADREAYDQVKNNVPNVATHPNTFAWFVLIHRFSDAIRNSWAGAQAAPAKGGDKKAAPAKKEEAPKKEEKPADDDLDLFGDDAEEDAVSISFFHTHSSFCSTSAI